MQKTEKGVRGRPSVLDSHIMPYLEHIKAWRRRGLSIEQICSNLKISHDTLERHRESVPEIKEALTVGLDEANNIIENTLFEQAKSGNATCIIFWLKNHMPQKYRDVQKLEHSGSMITHQETTIINQLRDDPESREALRLLYNRQRHLATDPDE